MQVLELAQKNHLYSEIKNKTRHEKLYRPMSNELVDIEGSSIWLTKGNIIAKEEAHLCHLQDRNAFVQHQAYSPLQVKSQVSRSSDYAMY